MCGGTACAAADVASIRLELSTLLHVLGVFKGRAQLQIHSRMCSHKQCGAHNNKSVTVTRVTSNA